MQHDTEIALMLRALPTEESAHDLNYKVGSGYFKIPPPNAWVCVDSHGRVGIYPTDGGWLGVKLEYMEGDIAPFCG